MSESLARGKERLMQQVFRICMISGGVTLLPCAYLSYIQGNAQAILIHIAVVLLFSYFAYSRQSNYHVRLTVFICLSFVMGIIALFFYGPYGTGYLWLCVAVVVSNLYGKSAVVFSAFTGLVLVFLTYGIAVFLGLTPVHYPLVPLVITAASVCAMSAILSFILFHVLNMTQTAIDAEKGYAGHMEEELVINQRIREELAEALAQKSVMLQELNHRVKNNMQVISSLINLTSYSCEQTEYVRVLKNRIRSITAVHFLLFSEEDMRSVNLARLVESIAKYLQTSFDLEQVSIRFTSSEKEILIHPDRGVNLAIVINELITNAWKHAFCALPQPAAENLIDLNLGLNDTDIVISCRDNGCGFDVSGSSAGLGLTLVSKLLEQAGARLDIRSGPEGTEARIRLHHELALSTPQPGAPGALREKSRSGV